MTHEQKPESEARLLESLLTQWPDENSREFKEERERMIAARKAGETPMLKRFPETERSKITAAELIAEVEQKPESAEFRTREEQTDALARAIGPEKIFSLLNQSYREEITARASSHILEAEARGAAEQEDRGIEEAKDEGANYVLTSLALLFGRDGFEIRDGSETWEGDVNATLEGILKAGGLVDDEGDLLDLATLKDRLAEQRRKDAEGVEPVKAEVHTEWFGWCEIPMDHFEESEHPKRLLYTHPANVAALEARVKELEAQLGAIQHGTVWQVIHSPLRHFKPEDRA